MPIISTTLPECPICLSEINSDKASVALHKKTTSPHSFHKECINKWKKTNVGRIYTCPTCRKEIDKITNQDIEKNKISIISLIAESIFHFNFISSFYVFNSYFFHALLSPLNILTTILRITASSQNSPNTILFISHSAGIATSLKIANLFFNNFKNLIINNNPITNIAFTYFGLFSCISLSTLIHKRYSECYTTKERIITSLAIFSIGSIGEGLGYLYSPIYGRALVGSFGLLIGSFFTKKFNHFLISLRTM